jgi:dTDP-4-dehydrorhamnose reductase
MARRRRILISGANGQLGRVLQRRLTAYDVVALSRQALDVGDLDRVREAVRAHIPDVVINAAAHTDVDGAEADPVAAYRGNAVGPRNLALATAAGGIPLVHVSADYYQPGPSVTRMECR